MSQKRPKKVKTRPRKVKTRPRKVKTRGSKVKLNAWRAGQGETNHGKGQAPGGFLFSGLKSATTKKPGAQRGTRGTHTNFSQNGSAWLKMVEKG